MQGFFTKITENPYADWYWNLPETKQGTVNIVGGNAQGFQNVVKVAEYLKKHYPIEAVNAVLPESLARQLPPLPDFVFLPATDKGSFSGDGLTEQLDNADYNLVIGDFSKNAITAQGVAVAVCEANKPTLITRDAVDVMAAEQPEKALTNPNLSYLLSAVQLQKMLQAVYYPKMLTLSMPLMPMAELLHKFTLSYPVGIVVLYNGQLIAAKGGTVRAVALAASGFSPLSLWNGELASKIAALHLYNPSDFVAAVVAAIYHKI